MHPLVGLLSGSMTLTGGHGTGADDKTCGNWTKSGSDGSAIDGHHDRTGTRPPPADVSWNSSHPTNGRSVDGLKSTGGPGYL